VSAKPDQARIAVGVTTEAATADDAVTRNATKTTAVLSALKNLIGSKGEIKTSNYSLEPQYKYAQGQAPAITGYNANQTVEVTLNDVSLVGKVIDSASKAGANNIHRIEFSLKNDEAVRAEALARAATKARANAETIAKALGVTVSGVFSAETTETGAVRPLMAPMMMKAQAMGAAAPTQIESGNLEVHASVTVHLEVH
jgi:hypothetical protein